MIRGRGSLALTGQCCLGIYSLPGMHCSLRQNIQRVKYSNKWVLLKKEFRKNRNLEYPKDSSFIQQKINLAQNYTYLLNSVHHHKDLLFSYNIAVDRSNEMKKVLGKSAASVGLCLPDVYQS
ncbi:hypothetical protein RDI58_010841 [Solanum bulbocastanum]|uniref:Uncharacterized protein n=1 Tax=Solanum bulbocastanum TaxID=147425 RepID=A0AAN8TRB1_SOLBU